MNESHFNEVNLAHLSQQRELLVNPIALDPFEPLKEYDQIGSQKDIELGKKLISEGKVGCLVLAGGQGTRLGFEGPKGMFPISVIKHKTLFQMLAEKVLAASLAYQLPLKIAFMTSPQNDKETQEYFSKNNYFGLDPNQISFFIQGTLPFLDQNGQMFLENAHTIAKGPDGNGLVLHRFVSSGIYNTWKEDGVKYVNLLLVDNPLAEPFDAELIGYHYRKDDEVVVKAILREDPSESVGVLVRTGDKIKVIEYSEISDADRKTRSKNGTLIHSCANISLFSFSMDFIHKISEIQNMPLHKAFKTAKKIDDPHFKAWKFETFIFDVLAFAERVGVLIYPRSECFAPLKQAEGANSPETVRAALLNRDRRIFREKTGEDAPSHPIELDAEFYYR